MQKEITIFCRKFRFDGGGERMASLIAIALSKSNFAVSIAAKSWFTHKGINFIPIKNFYIGRLWREISFSKSYQALLKKNNQSPTLSFEKIPGCTIYRTGVGVHKEFLKQGKHIKGRLGGFFKTTQLFHRYILRQEKKVFTHSNLKMVLAVSHMVKNDIIRNYNVREDIIKVIHNPVDIDKYKKTKINLREKFSINKEETIFLFVGSGFARKGLKVALEAFSKMTNNKTYFWVAGYDKRISYYKNLAKKLNISERVKFFGKVKDCVPYYHAADALFFPSLYEPFGLVVLEAMASGIPVLTSTKTGASELINHGHNGFIVDCTDIDKVVHYLEQLCDHKKCQNMGKNALLTAQNHSIDWYQQELKKYFTQL